MKNELEVGGARPWKFRVGNGEFGELYHLLVTAHLLECERKKSGRQERDQPDITICFEECPEGEELFEFFEVKFSKAGISDNEKAHLPQTANILFEHFHDGCCKELVKKIRDKGKDWSFPYPELITTDTKLLIWQRGRLDWGPERNSSISLVKQIVSLCDKHSTTPVIIGKRIGLAGTIELGEYWKEDFFSKEGNTIPRQLWFLDMLFRSCGVIAQVGMMSGAMDGPAMIFGHKTIFLARHRDATPRMGKVSCVVPNLIWQRIEFEGSFKDLTPRQLLDVEQNLWG